MHFRQGEKTLLLLDITSAAIDKNELVAGNGREVIEVAKICQMCGTSNGEEIQFCQACGSEIGEVSKAGSGKQSKGGPAKTMMMGALPVSITGGTFQMGSTEANNEQPIHSVTVSTFKMLKTEVTVSQYEACVNSGPCWVPDSGGSYDNWGDPGYEDHPVNSVDWYQAAAFCTWAGGRLPSESEREYAASNGASENIYPWGDETVTCNYAIMYEGGYGCGTGRTWSVCSKTAGNTSHGLCDMAGNVQEWVQDWYHSNYTGAPTDGSAWEDPIGSNRVVRGGSFIFSANYQRAAYRYSYTPSYRYYHIGFRCAR